VQAFIDLLIRAWNEHSIAFVFLSAVIGGFVGATLKLLFEFLIPERLRARREAKVIVSRYRAPLARSVYALIARIDNFRLMAEHKWFDIDEYYRLSTLYVFCEYFAWKEILLGELTRLRYESSGKNRRLALLIDNVEKAFNNRSYFGDLSFEQIPADTDVPKFACKALGEVMIEKQDDNLPTPIGFVKFCKNWRDNREFGAWLFNLQRFLSGVAKSANNLKWDRILIIRLSLSALLEFLDPKHEIAGRLDKGEAKRIVAEIQRSRAQEVFLNDCILKGLPVGIGPIELAIRRLWVKICRRQKPRASWLSNARPADLS
jgi:hypothetical protein